MPDPTDDLFMPPMPAGLDPAVYGGAEEISLSPSEQAALDKAWDELGKSVSGGRPLEPLPEPSRTTGGVDEAPAG